MTTLYLLQISYGRHGVDWIATEANRAGVIEDIMSGEAGGTVLQVWEVTLGEPSRDISEDIARDIAAAARDHCDRYVSAEVLDFIENAAGVRVGNELRVA